MDLFAALAVTAGTMILLPSGLLARRILLLRGGGTIEMSMRLDPQGVHGRGWALGVGRFVGDDLQWFRTFSLSSRPKYRLSRRGFSVLARRDPHGGEGLSLMSGAVVLECSAGRGPVTLAVNEAALTGFLSWLESSPPGAEFQSMAAG
jgi:hypothetical protein